ncbi:hypothetical protein Trydic_g8374 [Trypoxylus dichotomus]
MFAGKVADIAATASADVVTQALAPLTADTACTHINFRASFTLNAPPHTGAAYRSPVRLHPFTQAECELSSLKLG